MKQATRIALRLGVASLLVVVASTVLHLPRRAQSAASRAPLNSRADDIVVSGIAYRPDATPLGIGAVLRVRLLDLANDDSAAAVVVASVSMPVAPSGRSMGWSLHVPRANPRAAEEGLLVVSIVDGQGVRYVGTGAAHARGWPAQQPRRLPPVGPPDSFIRAQRWVQLDSVSVAGS